MKDLEAIIRQTVAQWISRTGAFVRPEEAEVLVTDIREMFEELNRDAGEQKESA